MLGQAFAIPGQAPGAQGTKLCHLLSDEALLRRLSGNTGEDCVSALRSLSLPDSFWTDEFKVVPCAKTYSHKWTLCPCAHIGETARRRCPRTVNYKAVLCPLVKAKKTCPLGDSCGYAHNVFEHWLHPSRYKTRLCSFGRNCNRSICFFAHSAEELRCVPCTDDKEGDEREYLMQIIMAQDNGLLPASAMEQMQPAPIPPAMMPGLMPDLSAALQHALQQPLPPSSRPSMSGLPDASSLLSARASMSGLPDLMTPGRPSLSGLTDSSAAAVYRASMSGVSDAASMMVPGRASFSGLPDRSSSRFMHHAARTSLNGLHEGLVRANPTSRPSLNGLPDASAAAHHHANMLLSMSVQGGMQRAMSNDLNAVQRAMASDLGAPFHAAAAMQHALSSDLGTAPFNPAAAAAAMAMERAFSREFAAAGGVVSPLQTTNAAHVALERAYSNRELGSGHMGVGPTAAVAAHHLHASSARSLGNSALRRGGGPNDPNLGPTQSFNSVESDSLVQLRGPSGGAGNTSFMAGGGGAGGAMAFDSLGNPQAPPRLSDPGANMQIPRMSPATAPSSFTAAAMGGNDSGMLSGLLAASELAGLESLLPLMNNALASGALALPSGAGTAAASAEFRRSNSSSTSGGRVQSPQLQDTCLGSPLHSGSLTPLSTNSAGEPLGPAGEASGNSVPLLQYGAQHFQSVHTLPQQQSPLRQASTSPPGSAGVAAYEDMLRNAQGAPPAPTGAHTAPGGAASSGVDQAYLHDLVARLQDQGVNKDQLVSSLSQLLAQLLSVST